MCETSFRFCPCLEGVQVPGREPISEVSATFLKGKSVKELPANLHFASALA